MEHPLMQASYIDATTPSSASPSRLRKMVEATVDLRRKDTPKGLAFDEHKTYDYRYYRWRQACSTISLATL